ncbi:MAG: tail fiber protein [candidate division Zixibacteria bacterium]|nr:tail fiber protein [candidate division Zixibacteria bacterium]
MKTISLFLLILLALSVSAQDQNGDVNCDATINILDIVHLINFEYKGGAEPCAFASSEYWSVLDSIIYTGKYWGISRGGVSNHYFGDSSQTQVNLGVACTTGTFGISDKKHMVIGGGYYNKASEDYATIPGGAYNDATGAFSFAAGRRAKANHTGTFVWADNTDTDFSSTADNQFLIRASGGVGINVNNPQSSLHIGGTSGVDGIVFPDGTKQTTAATGGSSSFPSGGIIMWSGTLATIPSGWALCNGSNGTPNLTDRFIYGVGTGENPGAFGGTTTHTHYVDPAPASIQQSSMTQSVASGGVVDVSHEYHTHTVDIPGFTSGGGNNLPPFYKLAYIMKL